MSAIDIQWLTHWLRARESAPATAAVLTFFAMAILALASMWMKKWLCNKDKYMKRDKPLVEELFGIAVGVVALCLVTAAQFLLLGDVAATEPGRLVVDTGKLSLAAKLSVLTAGSFLIMVILAASRTRLARIEIALANDRSGTYIPPDLETAFPRSKKFVLLSVASGFLLLEFYVVARLFESNVQLLRY